MPPRSVSFTISADAAPALAEFNRIKQIARQTADEISAITRQAQAGQLTGEHAGLLTQRAQARDANALASIGSPFLKPEGLLQAIKESEAAKRATDDYKLSVRDAAGTIHLLGVSVLSELNPALGVTGSVALGAARNLKDLGIGSAAAAGGAGILAVGLGLYIAKVKEGIDVAVQLAQAQQAGTSGAVQGALSAITAAQAKYNAELRLSHQEITDLGSASESIVAFWSRTMGPSLETLEQRAQFARVAFNELFKQVDIGRLRSVAAGRTAESDIAQASVGRETASTPGGLAVASGQLLDARKRAQQAVEGQLDAEVRALSIQLLKRNVTQLFYDEQLRDIDSRRTASKRQLAQEEDQIRREDTRRLAEQRALQVETDAIIAAARLRTAAAAVGVAGATIEAGAGITVGPGQLVGAQLARSRAQEQIDLRTAEEDFATRKKALQTRLGGATGDERAQLERQLTTLTAEEVAKRAEIEGQGIATRLGLYRGYYLQLRKDAETLFDALADLGQKSADEQLAQFSRIANDAARSVDERLGAIRRAHEVEKSLDEERFQTLKAQGSATLQDEIARQQSRIDNVKTGSLAEAQEIRKLAELRKSAQDQASGALGGLAGFLQNRNPGVIGFTPESAAADMAAAEKEAEALRQRAAAGGVIGFDELAKLQQFEAAKKQITQSGGIPSALALGLGGPEPNELPGDRSKRLALEDFNRINGIPAIPKVPTSDILGLQNNNADQMKKIVDGMGKVGAEAGDKFGDAFWDRVGKSPKIKAAVESFFAEAAGVLGLQAAQNGY